MPQTPVKDFVREPYEQEKSIMDNPSAPEKSSTKKSTGKKATPGPSEKKRYFISIDRELDRLARVKAKKMGLSLPAYVRFLMCADLNQDSKN